MSVKPMVAACVATLVVLAGGLCGTAVTAQEQGKTTAQPDRSRRVCRVETPSGSRLTRRTCRTQAEWDQAEYRTQDGVLQHQMTTTTTMEPMPGPRQ